jgi:hypothetical protein
MPRPACGGLRHEMNSSAAVRPSSVDVTYWIGTPFFMKEENDWATFVPSSGTKYLPWGPRNLQRGVEHGQQPRRVTSAQRRDVGDHRRVQVDLRIGRNQRRPRLGHLGVDQRLIDIHGIAVPFDDPES